jgi:hypothetical protein
MRFKVIDSYETAVELAATLDFCRGSKDEERALKSPTSKSNEVFTRNFLIKELPGTRPGF